MRNNKSTTFFQRLLLAVTSVLVLSCSSDILDTSGNLSGTVYDARTNEPIKGATVTLSPLGKSYSTGADGRYEFRDIEQGSYQVQAAKDGYKTDNKTASVVPSETTTLDFSLTPSVPILALSQQTLDFGNDATTLTLDLQNTGLSVLTWQVSEDAAWITCTPTSGTTQPGSKSSVIVNVSRDGLARGTYTQTIAISSNGGSDVVTVNMSVQGLSVKVSPETLDFGATTTSLQLTLTNTGQQNISYTLTPSNQWIVPGKTSGMFLFSDVITVAVSRDGYSEGNYQGSLTLTVADQSMEIPVLMQIASKAKPTVTIATVDDVTYNSARLRGGVVAIGSSKVTRHGFCWGTSEQPTVADKSCNLGDCSAAKDFEYVASQLTGSTKYYVRAYAENAEGISYSQQQTFTTTDAPKVPQVETGTVSSIKTTQAMVGGNLLVLGHADGVTQYGHVWGTAANPTLRDQRTELGATRQTGPFTSTLTGLQPGQTYHVRAYATNQMGTAYGDDVTFQTAFDVVSLTTIAATNITHEQATAGGNITNTGGNTITERGVCWATTASPTVSGSHAASQATTAAFTVKVTGLQQLTTYHLRAYAVTQTGDVYYGNEVTFKTTHEIHTPQVGATTVTYIGSTTASLSSTLVSDGNGTVSDCGFVYSQTSQPTLENASKLSIGQKSGTFSGRLSGLSPATTYYVRSYAVNEAGTSYGELQAFTTKEKSQGSDIDREDFGDDNNWD